MKNSELIELFVALQKVEKLPGAKFAYAVAKNNALLKTEINSINAAVSPTEEYTKYDKERVELAKKYSKKDNNGEPVVKDNAFDIEDTASFEKDLKELQEKHKEAIDSRENQIKEFEKLLEEKNDVELFKIPYTDVPEQITGEQLKGIFAIIS